MSCISSKIKSKIAREIYIKSEVFIYIIYAEGMDDNWQFLGKNILRYLQIIFLFLKVYIEQKPNLIPGK